MDMDMNTQHKYGHAAWTFILERTHERTKNLLLLLFKVYCIFTKISFWSVSPDYFTKILPKQNETQDFAKTKQKILPKRNKKIVWENEISMKFHKIFYCHELKKITLFQEKSLGNR
jgi:hypothetical protein